jgi:hypothetical protein
MRISQSMIKDLISYNEGKLCGLQFEEKFINGNFDKFLTTDSMLLGTWFEYKLTGALPKDGRIPEPKLTKKGDLTAPFRNLLNHINDFKATMLYYGFEIVSVGTKIKFEDLEGTVDIICRATQRIVTDKGMVIEKGEEFIVDLKTSGLLDNKWNDYGWEIENLANKYKLVIQPIMYKYIWLKSRGEDVKFLFFLFNTQDSNDSRIINFICDEDAYIELESTIEAAKEMLEKHMVIGWKARPTKRACADCPIKLGCKHFTSVPVIQDFNFHPSNM